MHCPADVLRTASCVRQDVDDGGARVGWCRRLGFFAGVLIVLSASVGLPTAGAGAIGSVVPAPAVTAVTAVVPGTPNVTGLGHKVVFPTKAAARKIRAAAVNAVAGPLPLQFRGGVDGIGVVTGAPRVYIVFWGSQWGTATTGSDGYVHLSGDPSGVAPRIQAMLAGLGTDGEQWSGVATQYCEGVAVGTTTCPSNVAHVGLPANGVLAGVGLDTSAPAPTQATDVAIGAEAVAAAANFGNTTPAANRNAQYMIVSPQGTHPDGFGTPAGPFCAWHSDVGSAAGDLAFVNLPYVPDAGSGCGQSYVNPGSAGLLDGLSITAGHEYAETITDPISEGGWIDSTEMEMADKCAWTGVGGTGGAQNVAFATGSFPMQGLWSNDSSSCRIAHVPYVGQPVVAAVGSPTTERLLDTVLDGPDQFDVHAQQSPPLPVLGDLLCATVTYGQTAAAGVVASPAGPNAGRDALRASGAGTFPDPTTDAGRGCVDVARSGSDPRPVGPAGDNASFEYYAMALDAVSWASPSLSAPAALTLDQLRRVFSCQITNWSQLPGAGVGPIQRVMPPADSDTANAFIARVLGFDPAAFSGPGCPVELTIPGEHGSYLTDATHGGSRLLYQEMILPYSAGTWVFQTNNAANPSLDVRNGIRLGAIVTTPSTPQSATYAVRWSGSTFFLNNRNNVVSEANPNLANPADASVFPGVHYLYDVVDSAAPGYAMARAVVGFDATGGGTAKSDLCAGTDATDILSSGFLDLPALTQANGNPGVTCRLRVP